jgi:hypothetical protein
MWDDDGENVLEHLAGVEDFDLAMATYRAACLRWPGAAITKEAVVAIVGAGPQCDTAYVYGRGLFEEEAPPKRGPSWVSRLQYGEGLPPLRPRTHVLIQTLIYDGRAFRTTDWVAGTNLHARNYNVCAWYCLSFKDSVPSPHVGFGRVPGARFNALANSPRRRRTTYS